jgi:hypothetical protein
MYLYFMTGLRDVQDRRHQKLTERRPNSIRGTHDAWYDLNALLGDKVSLLPEKTLCVNDAFYWLGSDTLFHCLKYLVTIEATEA